MFLFLPTYIDTPRIFSNALVGPPLRYSCQFVVPHLRRETGLFNIPLNNDTNWNTKNVHCREITDCPSVHQSTNQSINESYTIHPSVRLSVCLSLHIFMCRSALPLSISPYSFSFSKIFTSNSNSNISHKGMFERVHVKSRLTDKVPKHSKYLKSALHHANPFQMLQSKQRTAVPLWREVGRNIKWNFAGHCCLLIVNLLRFSR